MHPDDRRGAHSFAYAIGHAIWHRTCDGASLAGLIHHSDRSVQYVAIRYTERLATNGVVNSVGSRGASYDNAMAETINGLYKTELVPDKGPWHGLEDLELSTLEWLDWFNYRRSFGQLGHVPPGVFEASHYRHIIPASQDATQTTGTT